MFSIKDLARKVLHEEITEIKSELSRSKERNDELHEEIEQLINLIYTYLVRATTKGRSDLLRAGMICRFLRKSRKRVIKCSLQYH